VLHGPLLPTAFVGFVDILGFILRIVIDDLLDKLHV